MKRKLRKPSKLEELRAQFEYLNLEMQQLKLTVSWNQAIKDAWPNSGISWPKYPLTERKQQ